MTSPHCLATPPIFPIIPIFLLASCNFLYFRKIPIKSYIFQDLSNNVPVYTFLCNIVLFLAYKGFHHGVERIAVSQLDYFNAHRRSIRQNIVMEDVV